MSIGLGLSLAMGRGGAVGPQVVVGDSFTGTDEVLLVNHAADTGQAWFMHPSYAVNARILSNRLVKSTTSGAATHYVGASDLPSADYDVSASVRFISDNNASTVGVSGRMSTSADTHYHARYTTSGDGWQLYKFVAGVATQIGSTVTQALSTGVDYALTLRMRGTTISVLVDGVAVISQTDNAISAAGRAGVQLVGAASAVAGMHLDNFAVRMAS